MPIPESVRMVNSDDWLFYDRRIGTQHKYSWLPRRCYLSKKWLFLKKSVVVTSMVITGPDAVLDFESFWCDSKEFFLNEIKGR